METTRKWRYGVNRWWILAFFILGLIFASIWPPVAPHILVAPEPVSAEPLFGNFYLTNTLTTLILVNIVVILLALAVRNSLRNKTSLVPTGISGAMEALVEVLYNMTESTAGARWARTIFPWFASILVVVLISNWMGLIPGMEAVGSLHHVEGEGNAIVESGNVALLTAQEGEYAVVPWFRGMSTDLNFTLALALISVIATWIVGFRAQGARYLFTYFNVLSVFKRPFFGVMDFIVGILELISALSRILSFAFRLFGNMFAGMVLLFLVTSMVPAFAPSLIMTFEFFIGAIQAFVFGMLTLVFMAQATQGHAGGEEH